MRYIFDTVMIAQFHLYKRWCGSLIILLVLSYHSNAQPGEREHININENWRFMRYTCQLDNLIYDVKPDVTDRNENVIADTKPSEAVIVGGSEKVLKKWILPTANEFISDPSKHYQRPPGNPGADFPFIQNSFNDNNWEKVNLPARWGTIKVTATSPGIKSSTVEIKCK